VINSPDGIKAFTELTAGTGRTFRARGPAARSRRGIPDKKINRIRITMSDEMIAQALKDAGITDRITCPQAFAVARKAQVFPAELGGYCTSHKIRIRGCQPGCFP
jgi:hypothetical protein